MFIIIFIHAVTTVHSVHPLCKQIYSWFALKIQHTDVWLYAKRKSSSGFHAIYPPRLPLSILPHPPPPANSLYGNQVLSFPQRNQLISIVLLKCRSGYPIHPPLRFSMLQEKCPPTNISVLFELSFVVRSPPYFLWHFYKLLCCGLYWNFWGYFCDCCSHSDTK